MYTYLLCLSSLMALRLLCCSFVSSQSENTTSTEWPHGFDPERECIFACTNTAQSANIICSSEHLQGPIYTPPDVQHCSVYGRIICQAQTQGFKSLEIAIADHCSQNEPDLTGITTQSDSIKPCQFLNEANTSADVDCLQMNIFVSLGCEQTNATVIPILGWTLDDNIEHYCIYLRPPEPLSPSDFAVEPTATSNEAATVSSTPSLPACPNAIEPTAATISSTLRTFIETKLTPSLEKLNTSISIESSTNSVSSTDCVCSNKETVISRVITAGSVVKTSSNHASGPNIFADATQLHISQDEATKFKLMTLIAVPVLGMISIIMLLGFFVLLIRQRMQVAKPSVNDEFYTNHDESVSSESKPATSQC